ncbi:RHS repeat-associated core domain-containing protein [Faecalispora jeddahensis]|uniref:RHS repeat-associated core domain-containing protein n=1 Tax=Faecalispora jeddahensis TaxID=1414721 RepID=UPI00189A22C8|nr:RHS repeat-associated core domain-containing protein [Faecalispora jeddahensis]
MTGIVDSSANTVVEYSYDAWGKLLTTTGSMADTIGKLNPFLYRGYYFDAETELYHLNSRYYDAQTGRFLNADDTDILLEDQENLTEHNLFAYCLNNPANMADDDGHIAANIIGGIVGGVAGATLGYFLAKQFGLTGWKKWALISAATVGGAALGAILGPYVAKLGGQISAKLGIQSAKVAFKSIGKITTQKMSHINVSKHLWGQVLKKVTTKGIENLIQQAIRKGSWETLTGGVQQITYKYAGETIIVRGMIVDGIFKIGDAWVKK